MQCQAYCPSEEPHRQDVCHTCRLDALSIGAPRLRVSVIAPRLPLPGGMRATPLFPGARMRIWRCLDTLASGGSSLEAAPPAQQAAAFGLR